MVGEEAPAATDEDGGGGGGAQEGDAIPTHVSPEIGNQTLLSIKIGFGR